MIILLGAFVTAQSEERLLVHMEKLSVETSVIEVCLSLGDEPVQLRSGAEAKVASFDAQSLATGKRSFDELRA